MLTKKQLQAIEKIIRSRMLALTYEALGDRAFTPDEIAELQRAGLIKNSVRNMVGDPYTLGKLVASLPPEGARNLTMAQVLRAATKLKPLTRVEQKAIEWASDHAGQYIKGIADDMVKAARAGVALESGAALRAVQNEVSESIKNRETVSQLKTRLFNSFDDKYRDWQRVAATEMNNAIQNGIYQTIWETSSKGGDQLVFKRPAPDACKHCKRLYLEDDGITPKIFKLSDLAESNIGLKADSWQATVGAVHPWCFTDGHNVLTKNGEVPIEKIAVGDLVWTHRGRWRRVSRTSRRNYEGDVVVLHLDSGEKLITTPEHPYATKGRWVPASHLAKGDNLLKVVRSKVVFEKGDNKPPVPRQIPKLVEVLNSLFLRRVPIPTVDFHGNHFAFNGNVNVVLEDGFKWSDFNSFFFECFNKFLFKVRVVFGKFKSFGLFNKSGVGDFCSLPGIIGFFGKFLSFFERCLFVSKDLCMTAVSRIYSKFDQATSNCSTRKFKFFTHLKDRFARSKHFREFSRVDNLFVHGYTNSVIVKISQEKYLGFVNNFSVEEDESYVCADILNHNCQCQLMMLPENYGFVKRHIVDGEISGFRVGQTLSDTEYNSLSESNKQKTKIDAIMEYTGRRQKPSIQKSFKGHIHDNCMCEY